MVLLVFLKINTHCIDLTTHYRPNGLLSERTQATLDTSTSGNSLNLTISSDSPLSVRLVSLYSRNIVYGLFQTAYH